MTNKQMSLDIERTQKQDAINAEYEAEKARIENTTTDEREKARLLKALDEKKARDEDKLNKDMEKKKRKMIHDAAIYQKAISISAALINTAQGITAALGMFPPPVAWAMAAINAALGAVQIGLIAAQPIPPAAKGGVFDSPYIGGEAGREMAIPLEGPNGRNAIQQLASGILDVMSQSVDNRASISSGNASAGGSGVTNLILDGNVLASWVNRTSNNGGFAISQKVIVS
jgi:hypothetical protein